MLTVALFALSVPTGPGGVAATMETHPAEHHPMHGVAQQHVAVALPIGPLSGLRLDALLWSDGDDPVEADEAAPDGASAATSAGEDPWETDPTPAGPRPLPFDPLSQQEQRDAIALARASDEAAAFLSDRYAVIGAALYTHKSMAALPEWPRMAEVWFYDYGADQAVRALVDLDAATAAAVALPGVQPPLTPREIMWAGSLALERPDVARELERRGADPDDVELLGRLWTGDATAACPVHRCVLVAFLSDSFLVEGLTVVTDLSAQRVEAVLGVQP